MQTIVNLVSAGLGVAWVPESVTQFQRAGVVYRAASAATRGQPVPECETSLVVAGRADAAGAASASSTSCATASCRRSWPMRRPGVGTIRRMLMYPKIDPVALQSARWPSTGTA